MATITTNEFASLATELNNKKLEFEQLTALILPSSPSQSGWSASDIKKVMYQPDIRLYDYMINVVSKANSLNASFNSAVNRVDEIEAKDTIQDNDLNQIKSMLTQIGEDLVEYASLVENIKNSHENILSSISTEINRAEAAETTLNNSILEEKERAVGEENRIENKINNEIGALTSVVNSNKENVEEVLATNIKSVVYNDENGTWTYIKNNGTTITIDTNVEKLGISLSYDAKNERLVFTSSDGTETYVPLTSITNSIQQVSFTADELNEGNIIVSILNGEPNATAKTVSLSSYDFASSLKDTLASLSTTVNTNKTLLDNEITRAVNAENQLQSNITSLRNTSVLDSDLSENSEGEINKINSKNIHAETANKATSDKNGNNISLTYETKIESESKKTNLTNLINEEEERAITAENNLSSRITKNSEDLENEIVNRTNAIANVNNSIQNHFVANPSDFDTSTAIALQRLRVNGVDYYGMKGDKGDTGAIGATGAAAGFGTPTISVETLPAGSLALASVSSSGTNTSKVFAFDFKIPKGDKGDTGAKGDTGSQGIQGIQGEQGVQGNGFYRSSVAISQSATSATRGDIQPAGKEFLVSDTIVDTQGNVFAITANTSSTSSIVPISYRYSIKGATGAQGPQGLKGDTGSTGAKGDKGDTGAQGNAANIVDEVEVISTNINNIGTPTLTASFSGEQTSRKLTLTVANLKGATGAKGDKGDKGSKGDKGDKGDTGAALSILGSVDSENELSTQFPNGEEGQCVLVSGVLYVWNTSSSAWTNTGENIKGPKGDKGTDGVSISSIGKTGTSGLVDTYKITYSDNSTSTFTITNGAKGETGATGNGVSSITTTYQVSSSGSTVPTGTWTSGIPETTAGQFLRSKVVISLTNGTSSTYYSVSRNGNNGATGDKGEQGLQGVKGDKGETGESGSDGVGIQSIAKKSTSGLVDTYLITLTNGQSYSYNITNGAKGDTGSSATISVGTVSTGASGTNASVSNSGTSSNAILNFTIPRGATGAKGDTGPSPDLAIGTVSSVDYGEGSSATFTQNSDGVYSLNLSLERGPQGIQGVQGTKGDKGDTGAKGSKGDTGSTFTPSVDASGNLSWSNNGSLTNPSTVNIKGPKGDDGQAFKGIAISSTTDLNNYKTDATCAIYYATTSVSITNKPSELSDFSLWVYKIGSSKYGQLATDGSVFYLRNYNGSSWSSWTKLNYTDSEAFLVVKANPKYTISVSDDTLTITENY